jgi:hypothetical protein
MSSRGQLEIATLGSFSWMPYVPQGVKGLDDDDDDDEFTAYGFFSTNKILYAS